MKILKRFCTLILVLYLIFLFNKKTDPYFIEAIDSSTGVLYAWFVFLWSFGKMMLGFAVGANLHRIKNIIFNEQN